MIRHRRVRDTILTIRKIRAVYPQAGGNTAGRAGIVTYSFGMIYEIICRWVIHLFLSLRPAPRLHYKQKHRSRFPEHGKRTPGKTIPKTGKPAEANDDGEGRGPNIEVKANRKATGKAKTKAGSKPTPSDPSPNPEDPLDDGLATCSKVRTLVFRAKSKGVVLLDCIDRDDGWTLVRNPETLVRNWPGT